jgi:23S rRNA (pseudouridine1915-N3)-methyltransferase
MMQTAVLCLGKLREKYWRDAADEYLKRLTRYGRTEEIELNDEPEPSESSEALMQKVMDREAEKLLSRVKPGDYVIALCIDGKQWDSADLADHLGQIAGLGFTRIVFMIGGSLGLGEEAVKRADEKMSLSE